MSDHLQSLATLLAYHAQVRPHAIALRHKQLGLWRQWSWQQLLEMSQRYASALTAYGFQKDQTFFIASSPNVEVVAISITVQALGGRVQLLDQAAEELDAVQLHQDLNILQPDYVLVEQLQQLSPLASLNYHPTYIFYIEQNNLSAFDHEYIVDLKTLFSELKPQHQIEFKQIRTPLMQTAFSFEKVEDGQRFRVYYSHQELIEEAQRLVDAYQLEATEQAFIARAFSSVGHIRYLWSAWLYAGFCLNIPESLQTRDQDRQVISPSLVLGTKQTYERVEQLIMARLPKSDSWLFHQYQAAIQQIGQQRTPSLIQRLVFALFKQAILEELGFSQLKTALIVGEPVSDQTAQFYQALGIQLQHWGQHAAWQAMTSTMSLNLTSSSTITIH
ncbi:AMP-binding protein [Acinetobacter puyangensis]|uniref:AMP-binding enzyme n=1 Tax=Acinetobacter puyangensis TaxID=1096779 RepID=A0A240E743_9GAMM|nr:AMP-binding protein [Acinetobacter puyangensis]SNX44442.1 AMP-binding enzyme [Acinetobacter puyangensis]